MKSKNNKGTRRLYCKNCGWISRHKKNCIEKARKYTEEILYPGKGKYTVYYAKEKEFETEEGTFYVMKHGREGI
jgi:hypothetical protein